MFILLFLIGIPLYFVWIQYKWKKFDEKYGLKGPPTWSILGNIPDLKKASKAKKSEFRIFLFIIYFLSYLIKEIFHPQLILRSLRTMMNTKLIRSVFEWDLC